jgi:hypothetical protein
LLHLLVAAFVGDGPVVIDDTIERRWGTKIKARGIYRDPVRSSHGHFVKASGLRWLCVMLLAPIPWAGCVWALPFLTILAPSERYAQSRGRRHKTLTDARCCCRPPAARPADRRRQQLLGHRVAALRQPVPGCRHPAAARCRPV